MKERLNSETEFNFPASKTIRLVPPSDMCDTSSLKKLFIKGQWNFNKRPSNSSIIYKLNKTTELFHFEFIPGDKTISHKYSVWSMTHDQNRGLNTVDMVDYDKTNLQFNISITCKDFSSTGKFKVNRGKCKNNTKFSNQKAKRGGANSK